MEPTKRRPKLARPKQQQTESPQDIQEYTMVGVAWYETEREWMLMREISEDGDKFEQSYAEWTEIFENSVADMKKLGIIGIRVPVNVEHFMLWCEEQQIPMNAFSRSRYVNSNIRENLQTKTIRREDFQKGIKE